MLLMRPATSGRRVTDSSERRLPTAVMPCGRAILATLLASTTTAKEALPLGAVAGVAGGPSSARFCCPNQYPPAPARTTSSTASKASAIADLLVMQAWRKQTLDYPLATRLGQIGVRSCC